jgi:hypothetical protein
MQSQWFDLQDLLSSFDPLTAPAGVAAPGNLFPVGHVLSHADFMGTPVMS